MIYIALSKHHIRYDVVIYDKYHIKYDFMCLVRLSYQWHVSRRADPKRCLVGNAVPEPSGWPDDIVDPRTGTGGLNGKLFRF